MKVRIINEIDFGGYYTNDFIENNPELVIDWNLVDIFPDELLFKPQWNATEWIEGASLSEINDIKMQKAILLDNQYKRKISDLLKIPGEKVLCGEYETMPQDILEQRDILKAECNAKILALGITDFTYRKPIKGL